MALSKDKHEVGMIGLGIMGGAFATNLVKSGWKVVGYDVAKERCAVLKKAGVTIAGSVAELAERVPVVMTSLPTVKALDAVAAEIAASKAKKLIVVEMGTFPLADKERFRKTVEKAGHTVLDCPVSGTGAQAATKDLILYPSGDTKAIKSLKAMFAGFTRGVYDVGKFGNGSRMKYIANHLVAIHNVASGEAMLMAEKAGLDPKVVVECIGNGAGASRMFQMRAPLMIDESYVPATMKMVNWMKDMSAIEGFARDIGAPTPIFDATKPIYEKAMKEGRDEEDTAAVFSVLAKKPKRKR